MADFDDTSAGYDEGRSYERRDRSASPRGDRDERDDRPRDRSPNGRAPPAPPVDPRLKDLDEEGATNTGTNLFVTGIHPRLKEEDVIALFDKYGEVESCSIMLDPHTKESRGFGFVKMVTPDQADAAKEGLQGAQIEGRTLSIEKARRGRPRTPTPGKYFGPPKRGDFGGGRRGPPGSYRDRYDDRRGGYGRRDDYRGGPPRGYYDDYERRGYGSGGGGGGGRRERDDGYGGGGSRNIDRYESSRRDDYGAGRERRGGGYYDRNEDRDRSYTGPPAAREEPARESYSGGREYPREDRYAGR
ncbi:hypothetical protein H2198_001760 [Neophaeococcomyces mojaviensis]|uniref:Uncharacterized protein n=1 Tax=Neophaeococcomyces mojaviensis TaxID=3383035 RepID=A0ACC3AG38_9EURO|nr:hypothetical protein H2198_001760 [Knufia sp. JES_112]